MVLLQFDAKAVGCWLPTDRLLYSRTDEKRGGVRRSMQSEHICSFPSFPPKRNIYSFTKMSAPPAVSLLQLLLCCFSFFCGFLSASVLLCSPVKTFLPPGCVTSFSPSLLSLSLHACCLFLSLYPESLPSCCI